MTSDNMMTRDDYTVLSLQIALSVNLTDTEKRIYRRDLDALWAEVKARRQAQERKEERL